MKYQKLKVSNKGAVSVIILFVLLLIFTGCASHTGPQKADKDILEKTPQDVGSAEESKSITDISTVDDANSIDILVKGNRLLTYTSVKQPYPLGIILYFPNTSVDSDDTVINLDNKIISSVKIIEPEEDEKTTRIEISLEQDAPYVVTREGLGLNISFNKENNQILSEAAEENQDEKEITESESLDKKEELSAPPAKNLESITPLRHADSVQIDINADGVISDYKTFTLNNPPRIVFDVFNISSPYKKEQVVTVDTEWVEKVRHLDRTDKVRIVLDTTESNLSNYVARSTNNGLSIHVGNGSGIKNESQQAEEKPEERMDQSSLKPAWVNRIDFTSEKDGKSLVTIGTTRKIEYAVKDKEDKVLLIELLDTRLPDYRKRPLITTRFESAVDRVMPIQTNAMKKNAAIHLDLREAVPYVVEQKDDLLLIHFDPSSIPAKPFESAKAPEWKKTLDQSEAELKDQASETGKPGETGLPQGTKDQMAADEPQQAQFIKEEYDVDGTRVSGEYTGEKIALDFYETDIKNVFRILREVSGQNFAIGKDVKGKVTMTLDKPVPWDQVLDLVLKMNQLGKVEEGNIIRIATLKSLKKEEEEKRKRVEELLKTQAQKKTLEPLYTEYLTVNYSTAKKDIEPHIKEILSERGSITVDERTNQIVMRDIASKIKEARKIVKKLDMVTPQVIIEARIVEAATSFAREIGTQWGVGAGVPSEYDGINRAANFVGQGIGGYPAAIPPAELGSGGYPVPGVGPQRGFDTVGGTYNWDTATNLPVNNAGSIGFNFVRIAGTPLVLNARLMAMETEGEAKIISAPKIVTLDNHMAKIKQGLSYPYQSVEDGEVKVEFKDVDLVLEVTPHVTPDDRILMTLHITKNDLGQVILGRQSFITKEADTQLLVNNGDTIVIGGIIKTTQREDVTGWPWLRKIPIIGWLFKNEAKSDDKEELLIFITPKIVKLEQRHMEDTSTL